LTRGRNAISYTGEHETEIRFRTHDPNIQSVRVSDCLISCIYCIYKVFSTRRFNTEVISNLQVKTLKCLYLLQCFSGCLFVFYVILFLKQMQLNKARFPTGWCWVGPSWDWVSISPVCLWCPRSVACILNRSDWWGHGVACLLTSAWRDNGRLCTKLHQRLFWYCLFRAT
jgi:hypothetical protein